MAGFTAALVRDILLRVEKPARYAGGEFGSVVKTGALTVALSFPDLYEIGMSNNAIKILYGLLNRLDGVQCERVFAPAADLEQELARRGLPLFSLETRRPIAEFDFVAFSVGYELNATGVLQILDSGRVPLRAADRSSADPLVIGGGPGITNPAPWLPFFDFIYIGEAEGWIETVFPRLVEIKRSGAGRAALAAFLETQPALVSKNKPAARRAVWTGFGREELADAFPVASLKAAQDHGSIEIMRGCPNGCRFCNAGFAYRPFRLKPVDAILKQAYRLTYGFGYRELSLSSLSTGDYPGIAGLVARLNGEFAHIGTSFSLPSLKIDSLVLGLFREIKTVRKSGLTFAIESPDEPTQASVNKPVPIEKTIALLQEAKSLGWKQAKFYFMIGLPGWTEKDETELILDCLWRIARATRLAIHVNVSTFIPKPHTPFQWSAQLDERTGRERIGSLRARLPKNQFKVSFHDPFQSLLEGLIARGDERVAPLIEKAYRAGARFDAWEEYVNVDLWRSVLSEAGWPVDQEVYRARTYDENLPWHNVDLGTTTAALRREAERAARGQLTAPCAPVCQTPCGVCGHGLTAGDIPDVKAAEPPRIPGPRIAESRDIIVRNETRTVLFSFAKMKEAVFLSHLNVMTVFERALLRAGYYCRMTGGFNPKPVIEFANPLPVGFESRCEIALIDLYAFDDPVLFCKRLTAALPSGLRVTNAKVLPLWQPGDKKPSLMAHYWGGDYLLELTGDRPMPDRTLFPGISIMKRRASPGRLILRYGSSQPNDLSFRKFLAQWFETEDYLNFCKPIRLLTLAKNRQAAPTPYFRLY